MQTSKHIDSYLAKQYSLHQYVKNVCEHKHDHYAKMAPTGHKAIRQDLFDSPPPSIPPKHPQGHQETMEAKQQVCDHLWENTRTISDFVLCFV